MRKVECVFAEWPAPACVKTATTTRMGGSSQGRFASLNLGEGLGDDPARVRENRQRVSHVLGLPSEPVWIKQVHGNRVINAGESTENVTADGSFSEKPGVICAILTADCLPVFLCDRKGSRVGLVHAGWRGLAAGVIAAAVNRLNMPRGSLLAWLGPAIGPAAYEVGEDVRRAFLEQDERNAEAFVPGRPSRWMADLYSLARRQLNREGVVDVYGGAFCTHGEAERFFSFRRDGQCGRMASLIWME